MHMLSSRTGERHPVAASATLDTVSHRGLVFPVKIYRQYVVWQASVSGPSDSDVEIWDWQAGQLIWVSRVNSPPQRQPLTMCNRSARPSSLRSHTHS